MKTRANPAVERIRARLDHPIIDADGHCLEYLPVVRDYVREIGGESIEASFWSAYEGMRAMARAGAEQRGRHGVMRPPWWAFPAENTMDRATAMLPRLLYDRLDEIGLDYAVVYPTFGLMVFNLPSEDVRRAAARAYNCFFADGFADLSDRLTPVAVIPMHTPEEALAELDHAVGERGMKAVLMAGNVTRPLDPDSREARPREWMDTFGVDSPYDYDPVWRRCVELGVSPTFHSSGMGWGSRASPSSYVFNHIGNFAAAGEATCRSLFLDGVPHRFPELRFAFLEGGVAWAATLYADIIGHFSKRNRDAVGRYDTDRIDRDLLRQLIADYGDERTRSRVDSLEESLWPFSDPGSAPDALDEFARSGVEDVADIGRIFSTSFYFGCEADDPSNATAFDTRRNPGGARLNAIFSSDIGHWDVPDDREVLGEAWELVEDGLFSEADFRDFTFANPARLYRDTNPDFFVGTAVEPAVAS